ncbi:MAG: class I SAM-dependent methyltransferase [Neisseria sp.]|nr:class I SAM-dependent methyltransferase [Neisseria sp.]
MLPENILPFVHHLLRTQIASGAHALDATAGNGHDTLHLAHCVGREGCVWAFDVQAEALAETQRKLKAACISERVRLIHDGHEHLDRYITQPLSAAVFNLGYLPHGDKHVATAADTTLIALQKSLKWLQKDGILTVVLYGGHEAGQVECAIVETWAQQLPQAEVDVLRYRFANRPQSAPYALIFRKMIP